MLCLIMTDIFQDSLALLMGKTSDLAYARTLTSDQTIILTGSKVCDCHIP